MICKLIILILISLVVPIHGLGKNLKFFIILITKFPILISLWDLLPGTTTDSNPLGIQLISKGKSSTEVTAVRWCPQNIPLIR